VGCGLALCGLTLGAHFCGDCLHLLGGAGALEAVLTVLALHLRTAPCTINLDNKDPQIDLDVVTEARELPAGEIVALSNSFGFGGHNAVVAFRSVED